MKGYIENHVIRNEDESLWLSFTGEVPRVGETIEPMHDNRKYKVRSVSWIIETVSVQEKRVCSARVMVEAI